MNEMRRQLEDILREYGQELTVIRRENGKKMAVKAFLQPILKDRKEPPVTATPLGAVNDQRWLYIGPAALELEPGDKILFQESQFVAQEAMTICFRWEALYGRAILRQEKEAAR